MPRLSSSLRSVHPSRSSPPPSELNAPAAAAAAEAAKPPDSCDTCCDACEVGYGGWLLRCIGSPIALPERDLCEVAVPGLEDAGVLATDLDTAGLEGAGCEGTPGIVGRCSCDVLRVGGFAREEA